MRITQNDIGPITHLVYYPETPEDVEEINKLESALPRISAAAIESIDDNVTYCLLRAGQNLCESESDTLDLYYRRTINHNTARPN